jgi:hypothetical protein
MTVDSITYLAFIGFIGFHDVFDIMNFPDNNLLKCSAVC